MKILVIGDLHGRKPVIKIKEYDCMVLVGDVCDDKKIAPLYKKWFNHIKENPDDHLDVEEFFELIGYGEKKMEKLEAESFAVGRSILKYLNNISKGKPIFMVPGNWDQSYGESRVVNKESDYGYVKFWLDRFSGKNINPELIEGFSNIYDCQFKRHDFGGVSFVGYGLSNAPENPASHKDKNFSEKELVRLKVVYKKLIERLIGASVKGEIKLPMIFISHNVPYNTKLDVIKDKRSYVYKKHLGSSVSRDFILRKKPVLCFCGHIHEGRGKCKLGKTILINPGYGRDAQVLVDFNEVKGKVRKIKFLKS